jgi:peptidyl-prolyl cis-trans isomerase SurA
MKKTITLLTTILCAFSANIFADNLPTPTKTPPAQTIDQIVAVVNDDVITSQEFNVALKEARQQYAHNKIPLPKTSTLKKQILDNMIYQKLILQMAERAHVTVSDHDIDQAIGRIAAQNHITVSQLKEKIGQDGLSYSTFRKQIKKQVRISKTQGQAVSAKVHITRADIDQYRKSLSQSASHKQFQLADLVIPYPDNASAKEKETTKQQALSVMKKLQSGADFNKIATLVSGDEAAQTNNLGWRTLSELPSLFASTAKTMKAGGLAGPIAAPNGYHILKLRGIRSSADKLTDKQVRMHLYQKQFNDAVKKWLKELRDNAYVQINITL